MSDQLPDDAITAAADVLRGEIWADDRFEPDHHEIARLVLDAAAPAIADRAAATERERIRQLAIAEGDENSMDEPALRRFADLLDGAQ